jgi:hypothetical protein
MVRGYRLPAILVAASALTGTVVPKPAELGAVNNSGDRAMARPAKVRVNVFIVHYLSAGCGFKPGQVPGYRVVEVLSSLRTRHRQVK